MRGVLDEGLLSPEQLAAKFETAVITYPEGSAVQAQLDDFFRWYKSAQGTMNPVALAAEAQRRFVSIHPFMDGNGRVSRLVMDHALESADLPPALLRDPNIDYMVSDAAWADEVRLGVMETYQTAVRYADGFNVAVRSGDLAEMAIRWGAILGLSSESRQLVDWLYGSSE